MHISIACILAQKKTNNKVVLKGWNEVGLRGVIPIPRDLIAFQRIPTNSKICSLVKKNMEFYKKRYYMISFVNTFLIHQVRALDCHHYYLLKNIMVT